jgi:putative heme iron utilization protein
VDLKEYFESTKGTGVLATADGSGRVNTAIYARPHVGEGRNLAFIMTEKRSYANVQSNPHASYLFREEGSGYSGVRLALRKTGEEDNAERIRELMRRSYAPEDVGKLHLVHFVVEEIRPLVGSGKSPVEG